MINKINKKIYIKICMGSACFARGNSQNLNKIENYLNAHGLTAKIELIGVRCKNQCGIGPHIIINEKEYFNVDAKKLQVILDNLKL